MKQETPKTKTDKNKITVIIFIITAAIGLKFFCLPALDNISRSKMELSAVFLEEKMLEDRLGGKNEQELNKELDSLKGKFCKTGQTELVMQYLTKTANETGVNLVSIDSMPAVKQDKYSEIPIQIKLNGEFYGIAEYLKKLKNFDKVIDISEIKVKNNETVPPKLNVEMMAVIYML
ncbi:MAG: type 4a pilus biogenesis protein PilO [bacterium]|nr:type 4a pilus biogenesis protein PilO [bacterium]